MEGGIIVSERDEGENLVREGIFSAQTASAKMIEETQRKAREAFQRALTTPKAESSGFKTPARIAGAGGTRVKKALPGTKIGGKLDKARRSLGRPQIWPGRLGLAGRWPGQDVRELGGQESLAVFGIFRVALEDRPIVSPAKSSQEMCGDESMMS